MFSISTSLHAKSQNLLRVVEVWMDDWGKYFYERRPYLKGQEFGGHHQAAGPTGAAVM